MTDGVTRFVDHEPTSIVRISLKDKVLQLSRTVKVDGNVCVCVFVLFHTCACGRGVELA